MTRSLLHSISGGHIKWQQHPVILIDFNEISHDTPQNLQKDLENTIVKEGQFHNLKIDAPFLKSKFKCNQSAAVGIKQIKEKGYADKYRHGNKKLYLMALNFSTEKRNLSEWKIE